MDTYIARAPAGYSEHNEAMDTKSKLLITLFIVAVLAVTAWKYYVYVIRHDFVVYDQIECDPSIESCFAYECEENDEECDNAPFKKIERSAMSTTPCPNHKEGACETVACSESEKSCTEILCTEDALEEGETCVQSEGADGDETADETVQEERPDTSEENL